MSKEDKQAIDMANSSGERLERQTLEREEALRCEENTRKRIQMMKRHHLRRFLLSLIPALMFALAGLVLVAEMSAGSIKGEDVPWAAALAVVFAFAGGIKMADALGKV